MIAVITEVLPIRYSEYTNQQNRTERLAIKEYILRTEIGTFRGTMYGANALDAEQKNYQASDIVNITYFTNCRRVVSKLGEPMYINDITVSIVDKF